MNPITINIITALNCEAKPLIDYYRLAKQGSKPFDFYTGSTTIKNSEQVLDFNIIIAGIGQLNTATACGWLAAKTNRENGVWLNIGIAGHKDSPVGEIVRVCHVQEPVTAYSHYPALTAKWFGANGVLLTSTSPQTEYPEGALVDMEGAAFFRAAGLFASSELVQSLKVVSDTEETSMERLNATMISELINARVADIESFVTNMARLLPANVSTIKLGTLIDHLHCTVSQRQQFVELLEKLQSLQALSEEVTQEIGQADSMKALLLELKQRLNSVKPSLEQMVS